MHGATAVKKSISAGNRYPSGRRRPEYKPKHAGANNLAARVHEGFDIFKKLGLRPEWASQIGMMHLDGKLSELEMQAALFYAEVAARYDHFHPVALKARAPIRGQVYDAARGEIDEIERHRAGGTITEYERRARRARKRYQKAMGAVPNLKDQEILDRACLFDQRIPEADVPSLKLSLAMLASRFALRPYSADAMVENRRREKELPITKRVRLAVEAIERWFLEDHDTPETFRLGETKEREGKVVKRGIKVSGHNKSGGKVSRIVLIRCHRGDFMEHVNSLFLTACTGKGWKED